MSLIRGKGNKETEHALLTLLKQNKITGWRRHLTLPGKPDFAYQLIAKATYLRLRLRFPKQKVAVFVDGCFWHGCPKCYTRPKTNRAFWDKKRTDNMAPTTRNLEGGSDRLRFLRSPKGATCRRQERQTREPPAPPAGMESHPHLATLSPKIPICLPQPHPPCAEIGCKRRPKKALTHRYQMIPFLQLERGACQFRLGKCPRR